MAHALCSASFSEERSLIVDKIAVVIKGGIVCDVYGSCPSRMDVEIIDLDTTDPDEERTLRERL